MNSGIFKWVLALLFVMALVVATNLVDRKNFIQVSDSLETIYEDRLVAKDLIFEIALLIHEKSIAIANSDTLFYNKRYLIVNTKIEQLIQLFSETTLTEEESRAFDRLQKDVAKLGRQELGIYAGGHSRASFLEGESASLQLALILEDLHVLSKIQIEEGRRQMLIGKAAVNSVDFLTEMEIYILIALGIVVQVLLIGGFRYQKIRNSGNSGLWMNN